MEGMSNCCGRQGRIHRRDVARAGLQRWEERRGTQITRIMPDARSEIIHRQGVFPEWAVFMPSLYAGSRIHKMRWRKRRPLEPHYEGPLMQMKLKLQNPSHAQNPSIQGPGKSAINCIYMIICSFKMGKSNTYFVFFSLKSKKI